MKLRELVRALQSRGRGDEAMIYQTLVTAQLFFKQGLSEERVMGMDLDEIEAQMRLPEKPQKYRDWNFWWGEAACR